MASTNKTENYELNQWVGTDPVLMEDFNADNAKIDAALAAVEVGKLKFACGSYTGSGSYGKTAPNTLSFGFKPSFVIVRKGYDIPLNPTTISAVMIRPMTEIAMEMYNSGDTASHRPLSVSWSDNSVSWWYASSTNYTAYGANWQLNTDGDTYYYVAFGI